MTNDIMVGVLQTPTRTQEVPRVVGSAAPDKIDESLIGLPGGGKLPPEAEKAAAKPSEVANAVKQLNEYVQSVQRDVNFSIDKESGLTVVKVLDSKTHEVIRQFPAEEVLAVARNLSQGNGLIINAKA